MVRIGAIPEGEKNQVEKDADAEQPKSIKAFYKPQKCTRGMKCSVGLNVVLFIGFVVAVSFVVFYGIKCQNMKEKMNKYEDNMGVDKDYRVEFETCVYRHCKKQDYYKKHGGQPDHQSMGFHSKSDDKMDG